jgi:hypothetical protein
MKHLHFSFAICLGLALSLVDSSQAQEVFRQSRSPTINAITPLGSDGPNYKFAPSNGWECPTPSLSVGGYWSGGNDWANDFTSYNSAGSGVNNYGMAIGLRIPFGGEYSKYCKDYAKSLADKESTQLEAIRRNDQIGLLQQCYWLSTNNINIDQPAFLPGGPFSSLEPCTTYKFRPAQGGSNMPEPAKGMPTSPPLTIIVPNPPSNLILERR